MRDHDSWVYPPDVVAICDGTDGGRLFVLSSAAAPATDTPLPSVPLPNFHPSTVALSADNARAWVWDPAGEMRVVDLATLQTIATHSLAPSYDDAALVRLSFTDDFVLGGPLPGQLTLIQADPSGQHCDVE